MNRYDDWLTRPYDDWPSVEDEDCPCCGVSADQPCLLGCQCEYCVKLRARQAAIRYAEEHMV